MKTEIITIGDELMTGHTVDSNAAVMARYLTDAGLEVAYRASVADSLQNLEEAFRLAWKRADVIITTGGLGPTDDDITKRAIVRVFKRNLIFHQEILDDIRKRYAARGIEMPAINQNQALVPQGATVFPNKHGSAVGICLAEEGRVFISLPGVPFEMEQILLDEVLPYLTGLGRSTSTAAVKVRTTGIIESRLAELIKPNLKLPPGVRLAYLPAFHGVDLRVMATGPNSEEAMSGAREVVRQLQTACGKYVYGHDDDTLEGVVGQLLSDNDKTLAVAESCTGGQLGMVITSVPGASAWFLGGLITYANEAKITRLGVEPSIIEEHGAVSEACAAAMAAGCRRVFGADYALSITGIAGPEGGSEEKPVGTVYVGLASAHANFARLFQLGSSREANRARSVYAALELLRRDILDIK